jgi:hypothetical protein
MEYGHRVSVMLACRRPAERLDAYLQSRGHHRKVARHANFTRVGLRHGAMRRQQPAQPRLEGPRRCIGARPGMRNTAFSAIGDSTVSMSPAAAASCQRCTSARMACALPMSARRVGNGDQ